MGRKRTGLRNRYRSGRSNYSIRGKGKEADSFGSYSTGKLSRPERIAGTSITVDLRGFRG